MGSALKAWLQRARTRRRYGKVVKSLAGRRERLLERVVRGRTPLFDAAEEGLLEEVEEVLFGFRGTRAFPLGLPPRLDQITRKDHSGLTAGDVAEQNGHKEITRLLRSEQGRMEYFE